MPKHLLHQLLHITQTLQSVLKLLLNVENFIQDNSALPCQCATFSFSDNHHGHIISGDLRLIENEKLRKVFTKCPKPRENKLVDWNAVESGLLESIRNYAKEWSGKSNKNEKVLGF